jgi:hypothetical protein
MDRTRAFLNNGNNDPYAQAGPVFSRMPSPPAYYEELPPAYQAPRKQTLGKKLKNLFTRKKNQVHTVQPAQTLTPPPAYPSPSLPYQEAPTYIQHITRPAYQPGGRKIQRRKTKKRRSHKRS